MDEHTTKYKKGGICRGAHHIPAVGVNDRGEALHLGQVAILCGIEEFPLFKYLTGGLSLYMVVRVIRKG